ncbi:FtsX-like permease family protein [Erysipelothrix sp. HDW6C]|uniref:FtsX-like permease family protein n=1 Tax=Erysipelothrix sp. HDW6C TaxID=2714930 RepID=UPI0014088339|nr:FtsX-like permease family protein [Erysipelothrix sp. HDW6C]QIK69706.1 FtsX-like permease family protein [Erysipelothrix sp. HDW6C]
MIKIAFRNITKSFRNYALYFITLVFAIALFYAFNAFESQSVVQSLDPTKGSIVSAFIRIVALISTVIAGVLFSLILYSNQFIMRKRKQEMALYQLLGSPYSFTFTLLFVENLMIGTLAILTGITFGTGLSFLVDQLSQTLMTHSPGTPFLFSLYSLQHTIITFTMIFLVVTCISALILRNKPIVELLKSPRKTMSKTQPLWRALAIGFVSVIGLMYAYWWALQPFAILKYMPFIIILGTTATFGFFSSLAALFSRWMNRHSKIFMRSLGPVAFRQLGAQLFTTSRMLSVISIMLLLGMGAFATSSNLSATIQSRIQNTLYESSTISSDSLENFGDALILNIDFMEVDGQHVNVMSRDDFESFIAFHGNSQQIPQTPFVVETGSQKGAAIPTHFFYGNKQLLPQHYETTIPSLANSGLFDGILVVIDSEDFIETQMTIHNYATSVDLDTRYESTITTTTFTHDQVIQELQGVILLFTYIGFFVGFVFMLSALVVLSLQQLFSNEERIHDAIILTNLGASHSSQSWALIFQVTLYFGLPLCIASVHTFVGLQVMEINLVQGGFQSISNAPLQISLALCGVIYLVYYSVTLLTTRYSVLGNKT